MGPAPGHAVGPDVAALGAGVVQPDPGVLGGARQPRHLQPHTTLLLGRSDNQKSFIKLEVSPQLC